MSDMALTITVIFWLWVLFPSEFGKNAGKTVKAYRAVLEKEHHHGND